MHVCMNMNSLHIISTITDGGVSTIYIKPSNVCKGKEGKYVKKIKKGANRSTATLEIIHTDICGPFPVKSVDGYDSFITFTDDYSRYGYIYPIKEMSEALDKFKIFKAKVENQHDKRIKIVRSDRVGGGVLRSTQSIWSSTWTFCKVFTGKWNSRPVFYAGRTTTKWSS